MYINKLQLQIQPLFKNDYPSVVYLLFSVNCEIVTVKLLILCYGLQVNRVVCLYRKMLTDQEKCEESYQTLKEVEYHSG